MVGREACPTVPRPAWLLGALPGARPTQSLDLM